MRGSQWICVDQTQRIRKTPTWAVVLAVIGFFFLFLGLLFLLVKEEHTAGTVTITVQGPQGQFHSQQIFASSHSDVSRLQGLVAQAQMLANAA